MDQFGTTPYRTSHTTTPTTETRAFYVESQELSYASSFFDFLVKWGSPLDYAIICLVCASLIFGSIWVFHLFDQPVKRKQK